MADKIVRPPEDHVTIVLHGTPNDVVESWMKWGMAWRDYALELEKRAQVVCKEAQAYIDGERSYQHAEEAIAEVRSLMEGEKSNNVR